MTFKQTSVDNRVAIRDSSVKLGNLAQRLTIGSGPVDSGLATEIDALAQSVQLALSTAGYPVSLPSGTAAVKNSDAVSVSSGGKSVPATAAVSGNALSGVNLTTATDTVASDGDSVSIQDRNSNTLLGSGVAARVSGGKLVSAYFTALTQALNSDGNPLDITTARGGSTVSGRVRAYVANNVVRNVYLDGAAALVTGNTVPVQNSAGLNIQPGTVTVTNNLVASVKLPANYTAFGDGIAHKVSDMAGKNAQATAKVSNGSLTDQVLPATNAIVANGQTIAVTGGTVTLAVANGVLTATYTAS